MFFGSSKDSVGLQLADLCAYFISQHLQKNDKAEPFYEIFKERIDYCHMEPVIDSKNDENKKSDTAQGEP